MIKNNFVYNIDFFQKSHLIILGFLFSFLIPAGFYFSLISIIIAFTIYLTYLIILFSFLPKKIIFSNDNIKVFFFLTLFKSNRVIDYEFIEKIIYYRSGYRGRAQLIVYVQNSSNLKIYGQFRDHFEKLLTRMNLKNIKIGFEDIQTGWKMDYKEGVNPDDEDFQIKLGE